MLTQKCTHCGNRYKNTLERTVCFSCEAINEAVKAFIGALQIYPNKKSVQKWQDELKQTLIS